jgi:hypothetical protein
MGDVVEESELSIDFLGDFGISGFDPLLDRLAIGVYNKQCMYVCIHDLPYWIRRYLVSYKKCHGSYPYSIILDDKFENELDVKVDNYFKTTYPGYIEFLLDSDREFVEEMNIELYELGEWLVKDRNE